MKDISERIKTRYHRAIKYQNNDPEVALNECRKTFKPY